MPACPRQTNQEGKEFIDMHEVLLIRGKWTYVEWDLEWREWWNGTRRACINTHTHTFAKKKRNAKVLPFPQFTKSFLSSPLTPHSGRFFLVVGQWLMRAGDGGADYGSTREQQSHVFNDQSTKTNDTFIMNGSLSSSFIHCFLSQKDLNRIIIAIIRRLPLIHPATITATHYIMLQPQNVGSE